jgi:ribonuclease HII
MPDDLSKLSIAEIRRRFLYAPGPVSSQQMKDLRADGRRGVQQVYQAVKRRLDKEREERARIGNLLNFERVLWKAGIERIAGVDEVGVGPLAGPVAAAAVVFAPDVHIDGVDDSKRVDPDKRRELAEEIRANALCVAVGMAEVEEIDRLNVYHAGLLAMRRAIEGLPSPPQHVLTDARTIPGIDVPQNSFTKGDGMNFSIAAASIVAKVHRDALMEEMDAVYPGYGFARHKGYGTPEHQEALRRLGPCPIHRRSFTLVRERDQKIA